MHSSDRRRARPAAPWIALLGVFSSAVLACADPPPEAPAPPAGPDPGPTADASPPAVDGVALPTFFEPNAGQAPDGVAFVGRLGAYAALLSGPEVIVTSSLPAAGPFPEGSRLAEAGPSIDGPELGLSRPELRTQVPAVRLRFEGASSTPQWRTGASHPGRVHHLVGDDPDRWIRNLPIYRTVTGREIYPGIDVVFRSDGGRLRYDFVVTPGADPDAIRLSVADADGIHVDEAGNLRVAMAGGEVIHRAPVVWQEDQDGVTPLEGRFVVDANETVAFAVDGWDPNRALVIDPTIDLFVYVGGEGNDTLPRTAVDETGAIYIGGTTRSPDLPATGDAFQTELNAVSAGVIARIEEDGTLDWLTYYGGTNGTLGVRDIALDPTGHVVVGGNTTTTDIPTPGGFQTALLGFNNGWLARFTPDGSDLVFATYLGGAVSDFVNAVVIDGAGDILVAGLAGAEDLPVTPGAAFTEAALGPRGFVGRFAPTGGPPLQLTYFPHSLVEAMALNAAGEIVIAGQASEEMPVQGPIQDEIAGSNDAFVARFSADLSTLLQSTFLGGSGDDRAFALAVDPSGDLWLAGRTRSEDFPTASPLFPEIDATTNTFVTRLDGDASEIRFSTYLNGTRELRSIALTFDGDLLIGGWTSADDLPLVRAFQEERISTTFSSGVVQILAGDGSALRLSSYLGGAGSERISGVAVDPVGRLVLVGDTASPLLDHLDADPIGTPGDASSLMVVRLVFEVFEAEFFDVRGNDWWVETDVAASHPLEGVDARVDDDPWIPLDLMPWGSWAASFFVPDGSLVTFRARSERGEVVHSVPYLWPDAGPFDPEAPDPKDFVAELFDVRGNDWWVETDVWANQPIRSVAMQVDGGRWRRLFETSWGSWARSVFVPKGSVVTFRVKSEAGDRWISTGYLWPEAKPVADFKSAPFEASFFDLRGNDWWVEADVSANHPLGGVQARVDGGPWQDLAFTAWGSWAASFYVAPGSWVQFRALSSLTTETAESAHVIWPP